MSTEQPGITPVVLPAQRLALALRQTLPTASSVADYYIAQCVWDQAILEILATFANERGALPSDVREMATQLAAKPGLWPKVSKEILYQLDRIEGATH